MPFKRFNILSLLLGFCLLFSTAYGQDVPVQLENALTSKSVKEFAKMFDERVDITIDDQKGDYSHQQAHVVLSEFLNEFSEVTFKLIHSGETNNQSKYYIGKMTTEGDVYRVYVYIKYLNGNDYVQSIKFEKQ